MISHGPSGQRTAFSAYTAIGVLGESACDWYVQNPGLRLLQNL